MAHVNHDTETGLPASIEAAWGRHDRERRGPKPGLSLARIVDAAVGLASTEGIGAVSMARVAKALGASTMSLYRYVESKDELLALMVDAAGGTPEPGPPGEGWRDGLSRWARCYHDVLRAHPWVVQIPIGGPPTTPNQVVWLEQGLAALGGTRLTETEKLSTILLVSGFVRNEAALMADLAEAAEAARAAGGIMPSYGRTLRRLTEPERFPAIHAALAAGAFDDEDDMDAEFRFGLERLLDGVEALVRERA